MTDLEAIEVLQGRARTLARWFHAGAGVATLGLSFVMWLVVVQLQWHFFEIAEVKWTYGLSLLASAAVVPRSFSRLVRVALARRRPEWITELVRTEGARREVLESSFTLDSW